MCGIFGIWRRDGAPVDLAALQRATDSLRHRGPDDEGYLLADSRSGRVVLCGGAATSPQLALPRLEEFGGESFDLALGFRRLSILDLSPAGHQPMPDSEGRLWVMLNGEVYNYLELRRRLEQRGYTFRSGTDTEVLLAAYKEWGPECLSRFNGMWGLAIWDVSERRLFLARDRFGVKPLYFASAGETFAFGSEIKSLVASGVVPFQPDRRAVARYVAEGIMPSHLRGETFFEGVRHLPGGHLMIVSSGKVHARRWWSLPTPGESQDEAGDDEEDRYAQLFTDSVRLRLRADVPVGTCLSGGVDSSSIVAVAGQLMQTEYAVSLERLGEQQQTFSAVYGEDAPWDETHHIKAVIERTGAASNSVYPTSERLWEDLEKLVWHQDEPFQSTSIFAQWCVMSKARERGVTVLLDGQGADEVLGGYRPYSARLAELLLSGRLPTAAKEALHILQVTGLKPLPILLRALAVALPVPLLRRLRRSRASGAASRSGLSVDMASLLSGEGDDVSYADQRSLSRHLARLTLESSLPTLLRYEDRNSMAFSIEARVPFLDYRLVEYAFTAAAPLRIHRGWTKWVQRRAVRDLLPESVVWRRDKVGFETPEARWLREGQERIMEILCSSRGLGDYLDKEKVRADVPRLLESGEHALVWRWVNLALWLDAFGGQ
jgi:asparagine synthase (glutamine-hydrolysing)